MELVYLRYVNGLSTREDHPKVVHDTPISTNLDKFCVGFARIVRYRHAGKKLEAVMLGLHYSEFTLILGFAYQLGRKWHVM